MSRLHPKLLKVLQKHRVYDIFFISDVFTFPQKTLETKGFHQFIMFTFQERPVGASLLYFSNSLDFV